MTSKLARRLSTLSRIKEEAIRWAPADKGDLAFVANVGRQHVLEQTRWHPVEIANVDRWGKVVQFRMFVDGAFHKVSAYGWQRLLATCERFDVPAMRRALDRRNWKPFPSATSAEAFALQFRLKDCEQTAASLTTFTPPIVEAATPVDKTTRTTRMRLTGQGGKVPARNSAQRGFDRRGGEV